MYPFMPVDIDCEDREEVYVMQEIDMQQPDLELGMQELEAMEAPGWWTAIGVSAGIVVSASVAYGSYALTAATVAT